MFHNTEKLLRNENEKLRERLASMEERLKILEQQQNTGGGMRKKLLNCEMSRRN